jgi:hypothetical protein
VYVDAVQQFMCREAGQGLAADDVDIMAPVAQFPGEALDVALHSAELGQVVNRVEDDSHWQANEVRRQKLEVRVQNGRRGT